MPPQQKSYAAFKDSLELQPKSNVWFIWQQNHRQKSRVSKDFRTLNRTDELAGVDQARCCMNLCLVLMYCSANPGHVKEYVLLRIYSSQSPQESRDQNFVSFNEYDPVILPSNYKINITYGPNRTE